jgi:hypothetical protein
MWGYISQESPGDEKVGGKEGAYSLRGRNPASIRSVVRRMNSVMNGDPGPMNEVWAHGRDVMAMHFLSSRRRGWDDVQTHWEQVSKIASDGWVTVGERLMRVENDLAFTLDSAWEIEIP